MRVKPAGGPGTLNGRIDGVKYATSWSGTSGGWWSYPTWSQSGLFRESNDLIRQLDVRYEGLTPGEQAQWEDLADDYPLYILCLLWFFTEGPYYYN